MAYLNRLRGPESNMGQITDLKARKMVPISSGIDFLVQLESGGGGVSITKLVSENRLESKFGANRRGQDKRYFMIDPAISWLLFLPPAWAGTLLISPDC